LRVWRRQFLNFDSSTRSLINVGSYIYGRRKEMPKALQGNSLSQHSRQIRSENAFQTRCRTLSNSYDIALKRFYSLERKLSKNLQLKEQYTIQWISNSWSYGINRRKTQIPHVIYRITQLWSYLTWSQRLEFWRFM